jgi:cytochrome c oxidase subunit 4
LAIAAFKVILIAAFFMRLDRASALVRITAAVGFLWLSFLFIFAFADFMMRSARS